MDLFSDAARLHARICGGGTPQCGLTDLAVEIGTDERAAAGLLSALGYASWVPGRPSIELPRTSAEEQRNRHRLLALAARASDIFCASPSGAAGVQVVGALIDRASFDLEARSPARMSAGGRGLTFAEAFESCMGEIAEGVSTAELGEDPRLLEPNRLLMDATIGRSRSWVHCGLGAEHELPGNLAVVEAQCLNNGRPAALPAELVMQRRTERRACARRPDTNGVAAGRTREEAIVRGLLELIERDAVGLWWFGGRSARRLAPAHGWIALHQAIAAAGRCPKREVWFLDLTTEIGTPVVACCSALADGTAVVAGFAADLSPERAAIRAFLEMCQMELAQELAMMKLDELGEAALQPGDRVWIERYRRLSVGTCPLLVGVELVTNIPAPAEAATGDAITCLVEQLRAHGFSAYAVDLTREDIGIPVLRAVVPGLQSVKPSWVSERLKAVAACSGVDLSATLSALAPI